MQMRPSLVSAIGLLGIAAAAAGAQSPRTVEFGVTAGTAHHDFRYRYPGEKPWEQSVGVRIDGRLVRTPAGVVGVSVLADRYTYALQGMYCLQNCMTVYNASAITDPAFSPYYEPWQVTRLGVGVTLDRAVLRAIHVNAGVLGGGTERVPTAKLANIGAAGFRTHEWFAGGELGVSYRWRDLAIGTSGEYGRVPHTTYALRPYYTRVSMRIAYAVPVGTKR
jgi:hypothetical protein